MFTKKAKLQLLKGAQGNIAATFILSS